MKKKNTTIEPTRKRKKGAGRPSNFTESTVKKLEQAFSYDCSIPEACFVAGISKQTYYNHVRNDENATKQQKKYFDRFQQLRNRPVLKAKKTVYDKLGDDYRYAIDFLERKRPDEYSKTKKVDVQVTDLSKKADDLLIEFDDET